MARGYRDRDVPWMFGACLLAALALVVYQGLAWLLGWPMLKGGPRR